MKKTRLWWLALSSALLILGGCATRTPEPVDVGRVVVAPRQECPRPTKLVLQMQPKPAGYFRSRFLDYFESSGTKPTP